MNNLALLFLIPITSLAVSVDVFSNAFVTPKLITLAIGLFILQYQKHKNGIGYPIGIFIVVSLISAVLSNDLWLSLVGHYRSPYYGLLAIFMCLVAYAFSEGLLMENVKKCLAISGALQGLIAIAQILMGDSFFGFELPTNRAIGTIGSPVFIGAFLVICFMACWSSGRETEKKSYPLMLGLITCGIVLARAKGAAMGCMAGIIVYEFNGYKRLLLLTQVLLSSWYFVLFSGTQSSLERMELMRISIIAWLKHPWFGWGPDNFILAFRNCRTMEYISAIGATSHGQASAHNDFLNVLVNMGIVGLVSYVLVIVYLLKNTRSKFAFAAMVAMMFQAQVNPIPIESAVALALIMGSDKYVF